MRRVFVTGCSGEIGSALMSALLREPGVELAIGMDTRSPQASAAGFQFVRASVTRPCMDLLRRYGIDTVIHAAYPVEPTHRPATARTTSVVGTRALWDSVRASGVRRLLHLSSATVYGAYSQSRDPIAEDAPNSPISCFDYGQDKAAAEDVLRSAQADAGACQITILRPCFVLGPGTRNALVRHLCRPIVALPSTQSPMQFVHRDDLVRIILELLRRGIAGVFNVGASGGLLATEMVRRLHGRPLIVSDRLLNVLDAVAWRARIPLAPAPPAALDLLRFSWRVNSAALERVLPRPFRYTSEEAFQSFAENHLLASRRR